jgi:ABC-type antimicrobial peptide transport system permease subunit
VIWSKSRQVDRARPARLKLVLPITLFLIAFLLYANTGSATKAGIVLLAVGPANFPARRDGRDRTSSPQQRSNTRSIANPPGSVGHWQSPKSGVFAGIALLLAAVGIYSVLSYIVRGRSREIGIRTALGARTADVLRLVIVEGMSPTLVGIAAGTIAALASAKVVQTLVFGVSATDPLTLAAVAATLALVALLASLVPAYRALRLDSVNVLRAD